MTRTAVSDSARGKKGNDVNVYNVARYNTDEVWTTPWSIGPRQLQSPKIGAKVRTKVAKSREFNLQNQGPLESGYDADGAKKYI